MRKVFISCLLLTPISVFSASPVEEDLSESLVNGVQSCAELIAQLEHTDCGSRVLTFFEGGFISLGLQASSLVVDIKKADDLQAKFDGDFGISPHYSITSGRQFFGNSNLAYEYSFVYDSSYGFLQKLQRDKLAKNVELDTYAVGSIMAAQANLLYAFGANDDTPKRYATFGIGLGIGYASTRGTYYITEDITNISAACDQAVNDVLNNIATVTPVRQNCEFGRFDRSGMGLSGRIKLDARWGWFYMAVDVSSVSLLSDAKLISGDRNGYDYNPGVSSIIFAYLYDF